MAAHAPPEPAMSPSRRRVLSCLALAFAAALLLPGCASGGGKGQALERAQYAWSAAIRWGDFEGAWNLVDPAWRERHPLTDVELERYAQVQVSHYRPGGAQDLADGTVVREVDIGLVNRHTMAERGLRYRETWRWDEQAGTWWITGGLPDFWRGR